jgi:hypothetical protein
MANPTPTPCSRIRPRGAPDVVGCLEVDREHVSPGFDEIAGVAIGLVDHQVDIQVGSPHLPPDHADEIRAIGNIGHKVAIHDIEMDPVGSRIDGSAGLLSQTGVVSCQ